MKRLLSVITLAFITASLHAAVGAVSASNGPVITEILPGSPEEKLLQVFSSPFTEDWVESNLIDSRLFRASYTSYLASVLPLENILLFRTSGFYTLYSQKSHAAISVKLDGMRICEIQLPAEAL